MSGTTNSPAAWVRWFGVTDEENAASQLRIYAARVDEAYDLLGGVLRGFSGSPDDDIEQELRIVRTTLDGTLDLIRSTAETLDRVASLGARLG